MEINNTMIIGRERRPCWIQYRSGELTDKALFHCWSHESQIVPPSIMVGGHGGGVVECTVGIVELEDGSVRKVYPENVIFLNSGEFDELDFTIRNREKGES